MRIAREDPTGPDLADLHARHTAQMHADTPAGSIHMLPASSLKAPGIAFYVMRDADGRAVGMGAFKQLSETDAEIKSMHILAELRGRGLARQMLDHLVSEAKAAGLRRLYLETGSQSSFAAARALYQRAGFTECAPFQGYDPDPWSTFMTRDV